MAYTCVIMGRLGADTALSRKIDKAPFGASFKEIEIHSYASPNKVSGVIVSYHSEEKQPWRMIEKFVGKRLVEKYCLAFTHF